MFARVAKCSSMLDNQNSKCFSSNACTFGRGLIFIKDSLFSLNADTSSQDVDWADSLSDIQDMTDLLPEDFNSESKEREDKSEEPQDETSGRGEFVRILESRYILYEVLFSNTCIFRQSCPPPPPLRSKNNKISQAC